MALVLATAILAAMEDAGIIRREDRVRRVVIDLPVGEVATIHVERVGDQKLLNVIPSLAGVEIVREEPATRSALKRGGKVPGGRVAELNAGESVVDPVA